MPAKTTFRTAVLTCAVLCLAGCRSASLPAPAAPAAEAAAHDTFTLMAEADRLAAADLWPGFEPLSIPVAIYDGERTLLFRHPAPPEGFVPVPGRDGVFSYTGRHPAVTANSSTEIGSVETGTLMPAAPGMTVTRRAGVLIHELLHVYQREHHAGWSANEADLFVYPVDDVELLALRRLESAALRRATAAADHEEVACWARLALDLRQERFARLPVASATYERATELNEGLATFVEHRATGLGVEPLPASGDAPEAVRHRAYGSGAVLGRLLDRFAPGWRHQLEADDSTPLDVLLASALGPAITGRPACVIPTPERDAIRAASAADVAALHARRANERRAFLERPGWRLVVTAPGPPLFPQGFDPLNVQTVQRGEALHARYVQLGNEAGTIEILDRAALTEAAGEHPLFNGVKALTVTALPSAPEIVEAEGKVTIRAEGVRGELRGAKVERQGQTVTVRLPRSG